MKKLAQTFELLQLWSMMNPTQVLENNQMFSKDPRRPQKIRKYMWTQPSMSHTYFWDALSPLSPSNTHHQDRFVSRLGWPSYSSMCRCWASQTIPVITLSTQNKTGLNPLKLMIWNQTKSHSLNIRIMSSCELAEVGQFQFIWFRISIYRTFSKGYSDPQIRKWTGLQFHITVRNILIHSFFSHPKQREKKQFPAWSMPNPQAIHSRPSLLFKITHH